MNRYLTILIAAAGIAACKDRDSAIQAVASTSCRRYDAAAAKLTFAGHVGNIAFRNATDIAIAVEAFHPDGNGSVEVRWTVPPQSLVDLGAGFGDDWGIRAANACITTIGTVATWSDGRFALAWRDTALVAGDTSDIPQRELKPR